MHHLRPLRALSQAWGERRSRHPHTEVIGAVIDASWHVDTEAICPDCLQWIGPADFVRRNGFDLLEHEVCPPAVVRQHRA